MIDKGADLRHKERTDPYLHLGRKEVHSVTTRSPLVVAARLSVQRPKPTSLVERAETLIIEHSIEQLEILATEVHITKAQIPSRRIVHVIIKHKTPPLPAEFWGRWLMISIASTQGVRWRARMRGHNPVKNQIDFTPLDHAERLIAFNTMANPEGHRIKHLELSVFHDATQYTRIIHLHKVPSP